MHKVYECYDNAAVGLDAVIQVIITTITNSACSLHKCCWGH